MMMLKCLAEGSSGNCWVLKHNDEILLLDCGIPAKKIKQGIDYNIISVQGVCLTHWHKDHSLAFKDLTDMGLKVFSPVESNELRKFGSFTVQSFSVPHGNTPCFGFYIKVAGHKMIYATDLEFIPVSFKKQELDTLIIEVNYQDKFVDREASNFDHKVLHHCELQTAIGIVEANLTDKLKNVIITHMGDTTCDANECVTEIKKIVSDSVTVDYAKAGRTWYLE